MPFVLLPNSAIGLLKHSAAGTMTLGVGVLFHGSPFTTISSCSITPGWNGSTAANVTAENAM